MSEISNSLISDFLVNIFTNNLMTTKLLSELIKDKDNNSFIESLNLPSNFPLPFFKEKKNNQFFYIVKINNSEYEILLNNTPCCEHTITTGDYLAFKHKISGSIVKMLFISTMDIKVGYKKYLIRNNSNISIGRATTNDISYNLSDFISREKHVLIKIDDNHNAYVEDLKNSKLIYVNGIATRSKNLKVSDEIFIMGLSIIYLGKFIAIRDLRMKCSLDAINSLDVKSENFINGEKQYFIRTPRILKSLNDEEIEIDAPPNPPTMDKTPAILVLGPSFTMFGVMLASAGVSASNALSTGNNSALLLSGIMATGMFISSIIWPSLLRKYQEKIVLQEDKYRKSKYMSYIDKIETELVAKSNRAVRLLNEYFSPSPEILCTFSDNENTRLRLWERSYEDEDFLSIRIGTGNKKFDLQIKTPKQGFNLYEDELCSLPAELSNKYGILSNVPLTINIFNHRTVGIVGSRKNIRIILREFILNITALHSYDEVKIVLVISHKQFFEYDILKNVPHLWSNDKKIRYIATNPEEVHFIFNSIDEIVKERENSDVTNLKIKHIPHFVFMIMDSKLIEREAFLRYIYDSENKVGISSIFAYGDITKLPKACKTIIQSDDVRNVYYIKNENDNRSVPFALDEVDEHKFALFETNLSTLSIKRDSRTLGIAEQISFLQLYRVGNITELNIENRWENNNSSKTLAVPIGVMAGNEIFNLDIHESYHGCHGLVAGTTGSGKSEFLQSFILSLAINYSPREIAFVLVDFKGGDMARPFMAKKDTPALPHLAATISNLSGNILYRALVSFEAEIKSRQILFNKSALMLGVDKLDINSYHKYFKAGKLTTPLPHLVIIIDEFAQLKTQQQDFLIQLTNIAQVGRSLGIHLILATQKPNGVVDPQIWSNSRFKVCLKVADKQDSIDMINKPDSAFIKNPGRMYVQIGYDEIYECVQSGYSGADYVPTKKFMSDDSITVHMVDHTASPIHSAKLNFVENRTDKTQLEAIVSELIKLGIEKHLEVKPLWLDLLPENLFIENLEVDFNKKGLCTATIGLIDFVRTQEQKNLTFDFIKTGNISIYGSNGTGKTTFLQTLIYSLTVNYQYTPDELTIYAMDFGGRNLGYLNNLPHTGGVIFSDDETKISNLSEVLHNIIDERKILFAKNNCGTFSDFRKINFQPLPAIIVLIDNFSAFYEKHLELSETFFDLVSFGNTFGIYFVVTGNNKNSIYYKVADHISTHFTFKLNDPSQHLDIHNIRPAVLPEEINGRGITVKNKEIVEFQTALACEGSNESERLSTICERFSEISNNWNGFLPIKITDTQTIIEEEPNSTNSDSETPEEDILSPSPIEYEHDTLILGSSENKSFKYGLNLLENQKLGVIVSGNENLCGSFHRILKNITKFGDRKIILIDFNNEIFPNVTDDFYKCKYIKTLEELDNFIGGIKSELNNRLDGLNEISEQMFIIIADYSSFFNEITDEQAVFMRKLVTYLNNPKYGVFFICGFNVDNDRNNDTLFMSLLVKAENFLIYPNSYILALDKIENLPDIKNFDANSIYFCSGEKIAKIRWDD